METTVLTVSDAKAYYRRAAAKPRRRPTIRIQGDWLNEIGFTYGKPVSAEYAAGRIILRLEDREDYRNLVKRAYQAGSGLFQVRRETNNRKQFPQLDIWGFRLPQFGFTIGSVVIMRCEYGLIKLSLVGLGRLEEYQGAAVMETKSLIVTRAKTSVVNKYRPKINFSGDWLAKIGFTPGKLVAAEYGQGQIIIRLQESEREDLGKSAPKASLGLLRVQRAAAGKKQVPLIDIKGLWLEQFGFTIGKAFTARYEYGLIKLSLDGKEVSTWKQDYLR